MPRTSSPLIVAPMPIPFSSEGRVHYDAIERNMELWGSTTLSGHVLNTENGEEAFLSDAERLEIVQFVCQVGSGRTIVAGVDHPSTLVARELCEAYASAGADLIRLRFPRLTDELDAYLSEVCQKSPIPVVLIHQMAPGRFLSQSTPPVAAPERIADWVNADNVLGYIASADMRFETRVRSCLASERQFWTANGSLISSGIQIGATGACMMLANVLPDDARQVFNAHSAGNHVAAQALQEKLSVVDWQILSRGAAGLKVAMAHLGFEMGVPRSPQRSCSPEDSRAIREAIDFFQSQTQP